MAADVGAHVALYYDSHEVVEAGHHLVTRTGRAYLVLGVRKQTWGKRAGRWYLTCVVVDAAPSEGVVHPLVWHPRGGGRRPPRSP